MDDAEQTICLCMIVKNERHVLERCLHSVLPLIDAWAIADTGSTDGTQELIRRYLADVPGELIERPWVDFAHNRNEAIALAAARAHYLLFIDADEELALDAGSGATRILCGDRCDATVVSGAYRYGKTTLVRNNGDWRFKGAVHEYVDTATPYSIQYLPWLSVIRRQEGARSLDALTAYRDAVALEGEVLREPDNPRHMFYLAQSYAGAGMPGVAVDRYRRRAAMEGWPEETWYARYQIARMQQQCGNPWPAVLSSYLEAYQAFSARPEPLFRVGLHYRELGQYALALMFFGQAMAIPLPPPTALFVEWEVCTYWLPVELAVCCFHLGNHREAIATYNRLLPQLTAEDERRTRVLRNRAMSLQALADEAPKHAPAAAVESVAGSGGFEPPLLRGD